MSILYAEAQAIIEAIKITRRWGVDKRIIMTDCGPRRDFH
jgi:MinD-like ATPase involved in chromosome partitioning or flagellar assembly